MWSSPSSSSEGWHWRALWRESSSSSHQMLVVYSHHMITLSLSEEVTLCWCYDWFLVSWDGQPINVAGRRSSGFLFLLRGVWRSHRLLQLQPYSVSTCYWISNGIEMVILKYSDSFSKNVKRTIIFCFLVTIVSGMLLPSPLLTDALLSMLPPLSTLSSASVQRSSLIPV